MLSLSRSMAYTVCGGNYRKICEAYLWTEGFGCIICDGLRVNVNKWGYPFSVLGTALLMWEMENKYKKEILKNLNYKDPMTV